MANEPPSEFELVALELRLSKLLATGVSVSAAVMLVGIVLFLLRHDTGYPASALDLTHVHAEAIPHTLGDLAQGLVSGKPLAIMGLGLLLLVLTPVLRVAASILLFALQRDRLYTIICTFVLFMLLLGMRLGAG